MSARTSYVKRILMRGELREDELIRGKSLVPSYFRRLRNIRRWRGAANSHAFQARLPTPEAHSTVVCLFPVIISGVRGDVRRWRIHAFELPLQLIFLRHLGAVRRFGK